MNGKHAAFMTSIRNLARPEHGKTLGAIAILAVMALATAIAFSASPKPESTQDLPDYARMDAWPTVTLAAGKKAVLRFKAPKPPVMQKSEDPLVTRFACANPHMALVCAAMPLATTLYSEDAGKPVQKQLNSKRLQPMREAMRTAIGQELQTASFGSRKVELKDKPDFTQCTYRERPADFFKADAPDTGQDGSLTIHGRIIYLPNAIFYLYGFSASDLGTTLLDYALNSITL